MFVDVENVGRISVARTGPVGDTPLVFLHPVALDLTWWGAQFEAFGRERDVIAFDMPGHGLSADLDRAPSFDVMAHVAERVIELTGGRSVHLVGLSVGGMVAQTVALRRPDLVRSLCLVATLCSFPDDVRLALRERAAVARSQGMARIAELSNQRWFTAGFRARRPDILARTTRSLLQQRDEVHAGMWEMIAGLDLEALLPALSCPTLVITGDADINAPPASAKQIASLIRSSSLKVMPGIGHFPPFEVPDAFNEILRDFISSVEATAC